MDHLHIRLPAELKNELKRHCRGHNIAVTSAIIMMILRELRERSPGNGEPADDYGSTSPVGFILRQ